MFGPTGNVGLYYLPVSRDGNSTQIKFMSAYWENLSKQTFPSRKVVISVLNKCFIDKRLVKVIDIETDANHLSYEIASLNSKSVSWIAYW